MFFAGFHDLTLDPKNRVSIPSQIRAGLDREADGTNVYVVPGIQESVFTTLYLYPEKTFERIVDEESKRQQPGKARERWELIFFAHATLMEIDKQGRVLLPSWAIEKAGLKKQLVMTGARNRLVLWDQDIYKKYMELNWGKQEDLKNEAWSAGPIPPSSN